MIGFLKTYKYGDKWQWQREGHFGNVPFGANYCPVLTLLPFQVSTTLTGISINSINAIRCCPLERSVGVKILETIDISAIGMTKVVGAFSNKWFFKADTDIIGITQGYWYIDVTFFNGERFVTDLMYVPHSNDMIICLPDFNNDFNNDFLTCVS